MTQPVANPAAKLQAAADELRHRIEAGPPWDLPVEYVLFAVAHLLEEISRALTTGRPPAEHIVLAALEISDHLRGESPTRSHG